jgi:hypothetical protein
MVVGMVGIVANKVEGHNFDVRCGIGSSAAGV